MTPEEAQLIKESAETGRHAIAALTVLRDALRDMQLEYNERIGNLEVAIAELGVVLPEIPETDDLRLIEEFGRQIEGLSPGDPED